MADGNEAARGAAADREIDEGLPQVEISHEDWLSKAWSEIGLPAADDWALLSSHLSAAEQAGAGLDATLSVLAKFHPRGCKCSACEIGESISVNEYLYGGLQHAARALSRTVHFELAAFREKLEAKKA